MKATAVTILLLVAGTIVPPIHAETKTFPIKAFESDMIPIFSPEGAFIDEVAAKSFGEPSEVPVFGFDGRGFAIVEHDGTKVIVDPSNIELQESFKKKARVKCAEVNKDKDSQYATSMGFGDCI